MRLKISIFVRIAIAAVVVAADAQGVSTMAGEKKKLSNHQNRLANEASPYLLQHADNPVDWYPWGDEAFAKAKKENKPIFLSIGYSTCHWCHVMAHESFENKDVAEIMNTHFVCIKVDREERPDVDSVYMDAVQAMTGSGGWPLSVFLTPDGKPFYGGTYFPPNDSFGRPGFVKVLTAIAEAWKKDKANLVDSASKLTAAISQRSKANEVEISEDVIKSAAEYFKSTYDSVDGGFGRAPKFPQASNLSMLMRHWYGYGDEKSLKMVTNTLDKMANGGIYDHLAGGFHRYSTDGKWLVPHFEKMLYDQALLTRSYIEAYQITGDGKYANITKEVFDYVLHDMTDSQGGFYSAEDADSEGEEGTFYVWTQKEIETIVGKKDAKIFRSYYGVTAGGNFEHGTNILNVTRSIKDAAAELGIKPEQLQKILEAGRAKLLSVRNKRIRPGRDDKVITAWNGLMISSMAKGGVVLKEGKYVQAASNAAEFVLDKLRKDGRLYRYWGKGKANELAVLNDHAFMVIGLIDLYEATFEVKWLSEAKQVAKDMIKLFADDKAGGFYLTGSDAEKLIVRKKPSYDGALPSGNSVAALSLLRLGQLIMDIEIIAEGQKTIRAFSSDLSRSAAGLSEMVMAVDYNIGPRQEIVFAGSKSDPVLIEMLELSQKRFIPRAVLLLHESEKTGKDIENLVAFVENQVAIDGKATAYVCENFVCKRPVTDFDVYAGLIDAITRIGESNAKDTTDD